MKPFVLFVPGLANGLAKRPDLAANISNIMEMGTYVPLFPEFARDHAELFKPDETIPRLRDSLIKIGPKDPAAFEEFKAVDAMIGERAKGRDIVIVSDSAVFPVMASIELPFPDAKICGQIAYVPQPDPLKAKTVDKGIKVLVNPPEKSLYHIDYPGMVLIAPMQKSFQPAKGAQGHLPMQIDDYGVFVASFPIPAIQRRPFIRATQVHEYTGR
jgi:hypothetical protein